LEDEEILLDLPGADRIGIMLCEEVQPVPERCDALTARS